MEPPIKKSTHTNCESYNSADFWQKREKIQRNQQWKTRLSFSVTREGRDMMKFTTRKFNMESLHSPFGGFCHSNAVQNSPPPQGLCDETRVQGQRTLSLTSAKIIHRLCLFFFNKVSCLSQWDTATVLIFYQLCSQGNNFISPQFPL